MIKAIQGRINRIIRNNPFKLEESVLNMHACSVLLNSKYQKYCAIKRTLRLRSLYLNIENSLTPLGIRNISHKNNSGIIMDDTLLHSAYCCYAFHVIVSVLKQGEIFTYPLQFPDAKSALFVTWHIKPGPGSKYGHEEILRGCIGTFAQEALSEMLPRYALYSAFKDTRFNPISLRELPSLKVTVSLLMFFEEIENPLDWEIGKHGIQIQFKVNDRRYSSTFLPEISEEQEWSQKETMSHLIEKSGYYGKYSDVKGIMKAERYQSVKVHMTYEEYLEFAASYPDLFPPIKEKVHRVSKSSKRKSPMKPGNGKLSDSDEESFSSSEYEDNSSNSNEENGKTGASNQKVSSSSPEESKEEAGGSGLSVQSDEERKSMNNIKEKESCSHSSTPKSLSEDEMSVGDEGIDQEEHMKVKRQISRKSKELDPMNDLNKNTPKNTDKIVFINNINGDLKEDLQSVIQNLKNKQTSSYTYQLIF